MKRRSAIKGITIAAGAGLLLPSFVGCESSDYKPAFFELEELRLVDRIADAILPVTEDSPGAGELRVANFIDRYVNDCYTADQKMVLRSGLREFEDGSKVTYGQAYKRLTDAEMYSYTVDVDANAKKATNTHYFPVLKSLVLFAYFTSKEGSEMALRYLPVPGKYVGDYPFSDGDKAWAL